MAYNDNFVYADDALLCRHLANRIKIVSEINESTVMNGDMEKMP